MKSVLKVTTSIILVLAMALSLTACGSKQAAVSPSASPSVAASSVPSVAKPVIRLSTTTSVNDSGLLPYLQPYFEKETGYKLEITSAGTGAAIKKGETGDADMLLVHAKASEEEFISKGYSKERIPFMYNYFIIAGPKNDPAGVKSCASAAEAFKKIAAGKYPFISRGDNSGTNTAELNIWKAAGLSPKAETDKWYINAGAGMGECINMAEEKQAYILTDKATFLTNKKTLENLLEKSDDMKNTYSMLIISTDKWPDTNVDGSQAFVKWMQSDEGKKLINAYGVDKYGQQLFFTIDK